MSDLTSDEKAAVNGLRTALGIGGILAILLGLAILIWPGKSASVVTILIAIYAIVGGLVYAGLGIFSRGMKAWPRIGHILLGILFIVAGVIAFANLNQATAWLLFFIGILVGVMWIVEGIVSLTTLRDAGSKGWTIFFAIISILAGIFLIISPVYGAVILWWILGIALVVLGIVNLVRAFTYARRA
jgi:uncharacterized membrane protein HdeD (DUF308 family)